MAITAQDVNKLRQMTGAGMMDCKKALTESDGDFEKAIEILRKKGQKVSASRSDRETKEGVVVIRNNAAKTKAILIAFTCETDFVAKNEEFVALGNKIADLTFAHSPATVDDIKNLKDGSLTLGEKIVEMVGKIGEKLEISAYEVMEGEAVVSYVHAGSKLGVLVTLKGAAGADVTEAGRDVCMQIAAMNPIALDQNSVSKEVIEKEIEIGKELARQEGKPEEMVEKIALGKLNKFFKESTLLSQTFVKDNNKTIAQYLDGVKKGLTATAFKRISIG